MIYETHLKSLFKKKETVRCSAIQKITTLFISTHAHSNQNKIYTLNELVSLFSYLLTVKTADIQLYRT